MIYDKESVKRFGRACSTVTAVTLFTILEEMDLLSPRDRVEAEKRLKVAMDVEHTKLESTL